MSALLALTTASLWWPVQAADSLPKIQVYTEVRNAANIAQDEQGTAYIESPATTLTIAVLEEAGLDYDIHIVPWARVMQTLDKEPNSLAYSLARTRQREARFHWVGQIRLMDFYLFGLRARQSELPTSLEAAREFRIGSIRNDFADEYFRQRGHPNLVTIGNSTPWLTMMRRGRIDLIPFASHGIAEYLTQRGEPADTLVPLVRLDTLSTGLYLALSKTSDAGIFSRLRQAYLRVVADGRYEAIMHLKWSEPELQSQ